MNGLLGNIRGALGPDAGLKAQAIGDTLIGLGMGQPVASPAYNALMQRQQRAEQMRALEDSGMIGSVPENIRPLIAQLPPEAAVQWLLNWNTREPAQPKMTDDMAEYEYALRQGFTGSLQDWMLANRRAGATTINNNLGPSGIDYGDPPKDMAWVRNPDGTVRLDDRGAPMAVTVTGSPTDRERVSELSEMAASALQAAEGEGARDTAGDVAVAAAARAREALASGAIGGTPGRVAAAIPETQDAEVYRQVDVLKSLASAESLNAMRRQSPTGGALGNVTERELELLANMSGALDPASPNFLRDLEDYERTVLRTIHGRAAGDRIFAETRPGIDQPGAGVIEVPDFSAMTNEELEAWIAENGG